MRKISLIKYLGDGSCVVESYMVESLPVIEGELICESSSSLKSHSFYKNLRNHADIEHSPSELKKFKNPPKQIAKTKL